MRFLLMFLLCITLGLAASGQGKLIIQGKSPFWYVVHTMTTGETFAGVAKKYGVTTDYLRQYNNLQQGYLLAGTKIRIPIRNLTKLHKDGIPVYYQIKKGDNLYQIGQQFNKVSLDFLKNWNNIKEEDAREGLEIIVGYIGGYQPIESKSEQNFTAVDAKATGGVEIKGVMKPRGQEKEKDEPKPIDEAKLGEEQYIKEEPQKRREISNKPVANDPAKQPVSRPIIVYDNPASVVQQQIKEQKNAALEKQDVAKPPVVKTPEPPVVVKVPAPVVKKDTVQTQPVKLAAKPVDKPIKKDSVAVAVNKPVVQAPTTMRRDTARKATKADIMLLPVSQEKIIDSAGKLLAVKKDSIKTEAVKPIPKDSTGILKKTAITDTVAAGKVPPMVVKKDSAAQMPVKPVVNALVVRKDSVQVVKPVTVPLSKDSVQTIKTLPDSAVVKAPPTAVKKDSVALVPVKPVLKDSVVKAPVVRKDSVAVVPTPVVAKKDSVVVAAPKPASSIMEEGFFAQQYAVQTSGLQLKTQTMESSIFKTMSGWDDKKYYVLANGIPEGTIVRLTANNKSVCAKVLGSLPVMKGDNGLQLRVSNAAAAALGVEASRFQLMVTYFQ
jgi:LysM repeat protein